MHQVTEVFSVAGRYDLIAMVRVKSTEEVADTIAEKIESLQGITATETLIAFRTYSCHDLEHMFSIGTFPANFWEMLPLSVCPNCKPVMRRCPVAF